MCGIYGFVGRLDEGAKALLESIAVKAAQRGPHSHGVAFFEKESPEIVRTARHFGKPKEGFTDDLPLGAIAMIGHCRLATTGRQDDPQQIQPLRWKDTYIAHNGTIDNAEEKATCYGGFLSTGNDSEALAVFLSSRWEPTAVKDFLERKPFTVAAIRSGKVMVVRWRHPLYLERHPSGTFFGSVEWTGSTMLQDGIPVVL